MRKADSPGVVQKERPSGLTVRIAAFISALLLSLLCALLCNAWKYEAERLELTQGGWDSRILGELSAEELQTVQSFAHVRDAVQSDQAGGGSTVDLYFSNRRCAIPETAQIARRLGIPQERIAYNEELLALYGLRAPGDSAPRLVLPLFALITLTASFSLIVIIRHAFAVSMDASVHQLGILSSVGATPRQIRACLLRDTAALCAGPVAAGTLLGVAGSAALLALMDAYIGDGVPGRHPLAFGYPLPVLALTGLVIFVTIGMSAYLPARRLGRLTPLEAIKNTGELQLRRKRSARLLSLLFGAEGELAGNALKAQRKALRTASLSLVLSFLAFALMQCFFTLSQISTRETYFERYQDVWDVMTTVKGTPIDGFTEAEAIRALDGVKSVIVYQRASAKRVIDGEEMSEEMKALGGFAGAPAGDVSRSDGGWTVSAPIVILDDRSFSAYCEQLGIAPRLDGAVVLNQIRDVNNPDFRHPAFMPYLKGERATSVLRQSGDEAVAAEVPVLSYARQVPALREEYAKIDYYELVHFLPASLWKGIKGQIGGAEADSFLCVRARDGATLEELSAIQDEIARLIGGRYAIEQENRIEEREINDRQIGGMMTLFRGFCALLALIGVGNVFSGTIGFVRQRRREFARYLSVGLTPKQLQKMFCIEALVIAGRPVLIGLPVVAAAVALMLKASYMQAREFMAQAPYVPILLFLLAILGCVALAYALAWRRVRRLSIAEVLRDDTMI